MSLIDECLQALDGEATLLPEKEGKDILHQLTQMFPFTRWGRIDWPQVRQHVEMDSVSEVLPVLLNKGSNTHVAVLIVWDEATKPVMESNLYTVLSHIEEVTIVSFDTWIFCPTEHYVVELYHEGDITVGWSEQKAADHV